MSAAKISRRVLRAVNLASFSLLAVGGCQRGDAASFTHAKVTAARATLSATAARAPLSGVVSEGDSISVFWSGNHTGIYAKTHPNVTFYGRAVGGSTLGSLIARQSADMALRPRVLTVLIGANDLYRVGLAWYRWKSVRSYLDSLFTYVARFRAAGTKVAVATVLPQCVSGNPQEGMDLATNRNRTKVNAAIRAAVGTRIDAVIDYAADPVMGPDTAACDPSLYKGGLHPTDGKGGQGILERIYAPVVDRLLASDFGGVG